MEKENFIETILNSTNAITRVAPNADLFSKIELKIQSVATVSTKIVWMAAALIIVLISINLSVLFKSKTNSENEVLTSLAVTLDKSNQLY